MGVSAEDGGGTDEATTPSGENEGTVAWHEGQRLADASISTPHCRQTMLKKGTRGRRTGWAHYAPKWEQVPAGRDLTIL